jgi:hypothetical protein
MGESTPVNVVRSAVRALNDGDVDGYVRDLGQLFRQIAGEQEGAQ